ncbi:hypothetical protein SLE2022_045280 [Rubroshorea leprosula]
MEFPSLSLLLLLPFFSLPSPTQSKLSPDYYNKTCPSFFSIMEKVVFDKQMSAPTTAAGTLRIFFHDCMVGGCDASILIASNAFNKGERDADINLSLPGDAFDLVTRAKTAIELECPGIVSCSDILAVATRNLITMVGGPRYDIRLGRKDSLVSLISNVNGHLATAEMSVDQIIPLFAANGFSIQETVALMGAHTIGFSHCKEFGDRLFNFSKTSETDPAYDPAFATGLKKLCANYTTNLELAAFNDVITPGKFDNMYFKNLQRGLGLLKVDNDLVVDKRTKPFVDLYAADQKAFFEAFSHAMEKVSVYKVKTGKKGEVRRRCDQFNNINA